MLPQGDLNFHARIRVVAEDLDHLADRLSLPGRLLNNLDHHHLPSYGLELATRGNQDILADASVLGNHEQHAVFIVNAPDDTVVRAFQYLDNLAFGPATAVNADNTRHDAIAVQGLIHLLRAEKQVRAFLVRNQETVAVRMAFDAPANKVGFVRNEVIAAAVLHDLAFTPHRAEATRKSVELLLRDIEQFSQFIER